MPNANENFVKLLSTFNFITEDDGADIGENRLTALRAFKELANADAVFLWLLEQQDDRIEFRLSYAIPEPEDINKTTALGCEVRATRNDLKPKTISKATSQLLTLKIQALHQKQNVSPKIIHIPLDRLIPGTGRTPEPDGGNASTLGVVSLVNPRMGGGPDNADAAIQVLCHSISQLIEHSRVRRILFAWTSASEIFRQNNAPTDVVRDVLCLISQHCAAEAAVLFDVTTGKPIVSRLMAAPFPRNDHEKQQITFLQDRDVPTKPRRAAAAQCLFPIKNLMETPILTPTYKFNTLPFCPAASFGATFSISNRPFQQIIAINKQSPRYLGDMFSATDSAMAQITCEQLGSFLEQHFTSNQIEVVPKFFESVPVGAILSAHHLHEFITQHIPAARDSAVVRVEPRPGGGIDLTKDETTKDCTHHKALALIANSFRSMLAHAHDGFSEEPQAAALCDSPDECSLIYRIGTTYVPGRYYVVKLQTTELEVFRFKFLRQLFQEAHLYHRHKDYGEERASLLAQIRHAVINPLAAAKNAMETYEKVLKNRSRSEDSWRSLRTDTHARELVTKSVYAANQALIFSETGRYILSKVNYKNIRFGFFRPLDIVIEVAQCLEWDIRDRGQTLKWQLLGDDKRQAQGDRDLIWLAIANILDNAVKYGHRNTQITIILQQKGDRWRLEITNQGEYLDSKLRAYVFLPFHRVVQSDATGRRPGTGLGLPVARMLLEAHDEGSNLRFTSRRVLGREKAETTFAFDLPYRLSKGAM